MLRKDVFPINPANKGLTIFSCCWFYFFAWLGVLDVWFDFFVMIFVLTECSKNFRICTKKFGLLGRPETKLPFSLPRGNIIFYVLNCGGYALVLLWFQHLNLLRAIKSFYNIVEHNMITIDCHPKFWAATHGQGMSLLYFLKNISKYSIYMKIIEIMILMMLACIEKIHFENLHFFFD